MDDEAEALVVLFESAVELVKNPAFDDVRIVPDGGAVVNGAVDRGTEVDIDEFEITEMVVELVEFVDGRTDVVVLTNVEDELTCIIWVTEVPLVPVGPTGILLVVALPYGELLVLEEEKKLEGPVLRGIVDGTEDELRGSVGSATTLLLVLLLYGELLMLDGVIKLDVPVPRGREYELFVLEKPEDVDEGRVMMGTVGPMLAEDSVVLP